MENIINLNQESISNISTPNGIHSTGKYSVSFEVWINSLSTSTGNAVYCRHVSVVGASPKFYFGFNTAANPRIVIGHNDVTLSAYSTSNVATSRTRHFITCVIDNNGATNSYRMYMDGDSITVTTANTTYKPETGITEINLGQWTNDNNPFDDLLPYQSPN